MYKLKLIIYAILFYPIWMVARRSETFMEDFRQWFRVLSIDKGSEYKTFVWCLSSLPEYRSLLLFRLKGLAYYFVSLFVSPMQTLLLHTPSKNVGTGLVLQHAYSTVLLAERIGRNCQIWQNVTIGKKMPGGAMPVIGNNVMIFAGAVVVGDITVGDNVIIGANSVVTKSVPANCVVAGNPARIIKRNGERVNEKL